MSKHLCYVWVKFSLSCSRKCLHLSIYILLKQNSVPAASRPTLSLSGKRAQSCQWKIATLPAKPDQLGSAGYSSWQVAQRAGELQGALVWGRKHDRTQTGKRWSKTSKLLTFHAGMGKQWASPGGSQVSKKRWNFQKGKKKQQWPDRLCVQHQTFLDWQRPAAYICFLRKAEQETLFGWYSSRWLWCQWVHW